MVTPVTASSAQSAASTASVGLADNFDTFLKLLTTQLQHQDPLSPMDSNQFTQQLVQFAGVEQAISSNKNLEKLVNLQLSTATSTAASYIGKEVTAGGDVSDLAHGTAHWNYTLAGNASNTDITVTDLAGKVVFNTHGETAKGEHNFTWDGRDNDGGTAPDGSYRISIAAKNGNSTISTSTDVEGIVTSVDIDNGEPLLNIGGISLKLSDIIRIASPPVNPPPDNSTSS